MLSLIGSTTDRTRLSNLTVRHCLYHRELLLLLELQDLLLRYHIEAEVRTLLINNRAVASPFAFIAASAVPNSSQ